MIRRLSMEVPQKNYVIQPYEKLFITLLTRNFLKDFIKKPLMVRLK